MVINQPIEMDGESTAKVLEIPKTNPPLFSKAKRLTTSSLPLKLIGLVVVPAVAWYEIYRFQTDYTYVSKLKPYKGQVNQGMSILLNF